MVLICLGSTSLTPAAPNMREKMLNKQRKEGTGGGDQSFPAPTWDSLCDPQSQQQQKLQCNLPSVEYWSCLGGHIGGPQHQNMTQALHLSLAPPLALESYRKFSCSQKVMEGGHSGDLYMLFYHFSTGVSISSPVKWIVPASPSVVMIRVANAYEACSVLPSTGLPFIKCVLLLLLLSLLSELML